MGRRKEGQEISCILAKLTSSLALLLPPPLLLFPYFFPVCMFFLSCSVFVQSSSSSFCVEIAPFLLPGNKKKRITSMFSYLKNPSKFAVITLVIVVVIVVVAVVFLLIRVADPISSLPCYNVFVLLIGVVPFHPFVCVWFASLPLSLPLSLSRVSVSISSLSIARFTPRSSEWRIQRGRRFRAVITS